MTNFGKAIAVLTAAFMGSTLRAQVVDTVRTTVDTTRRVAESTLKVTDTAKTTIDTSKRNVDTTGRRSDTSGVSVGSPRKSSATPRNSTAATSSASPSGDVSIPAVSGPVRLAADLSQRTLTVMAGDNSVKTFRVAVGTAAKPTPKGAFKIRKIVWNPAWIPPAEPWAKGKTP